MSYMRRNQEHVISYISNKLQHSFMHFFSEMAWTITYIVITNIVRTSVTRFAVLI